MIVCGHSNVAAVDGEWRGKIDERVGKALDLFPGQTLFGVSAEGSRRLFLSSLMLNPHVSYFRVFMEDVRGSLATITRLFSDKGINILSGGAFGFGNIWVSEYIADFKDVDVTPEEIAAEMEGLGGFVTIREITELFPRAFELNTVYEIGEDGEGDMYLRLQGQPEGMAGGRAEQAVLKAWPNVQALFVDFHSADSKLLRITAKIGDVPGSLFTLSETIGIQVNMHAISEQHHDEASGAWTMYGTLEIGSLKDLEEKLAGLSAVLGVYVEPLGW